MISHFNAPVSGLNLKVTFCGEVKLWNGARADIFVLHLGANHPLCHYITAANGFTDEQHKIVPDREMQEVFFFLYCNGISVKINWNFDVTNRTFITPNQRGALRQIHANKALVMSHGKMFCYLVQDSGSISAVHNLLLITPVRIGRLQSWKKACWTA